MNLAQHRTSESIGCCFKLSRPERLKALQLETFLTCTQTPETFLPAPWKPGSCPPSSPSDRQSKRSCPGRQSPLTGRLFQRLTKAVPQAQANSAAAKSRKQRRRKGIWRSRWNRRDIGCSGRRQSDRRRSKVPSSTSRATRTSGNIAIPSPA
jgi:hypothetical protein